MISVVCVYNNKTILNDILLKSLKPQTAEFELILLDNREGRFTSAASALNYGGEKATGDYIMFIHQDMWLDTPTWIEDAEKWMRTLPDAGVAGVLGIAILPGQANLAMKFSIHIFEGMFKNKKPVEHPEPVESLDECLLIVPRNVFEKLKFDEVVFDGWDCYAPDYCLAIKPLGLKSYVIPGASSHCCLRRNYMLWEFRDLLKYHRRLYQKYKKDYKIIHTLMGPISWKTLHLRAIQRLIAPFFERLFPRVSRMLSKELAGCKTVLDLGCGYISPLSCCDFESTVGVDLSYPALAESKRHRALNHHALGDLRQMDFKPKSFDAVIALNVLEHLPKDEGKILLKKMESWAKEKNFFLVQKDSTTYQRLSSKWQSKDFSDQGYRTVTGNFIFVKGASGEKRLISAGLPPFYAMACFLDLFSRISKKTNSIVAIKQIKK